MNQRTVAFTSDFDNGCDHCHKMIPRGEIFTNTQIDGINCDYCAGIWPLVFIPSSKPDLIKKAKRISDVFIRVLRFEDEYRHQRQMGILVSESASKLLSIDELYLD